MVAATTPELKIPEGLSLKNIRRAENIPDKYIKDNFILEEHRGRHVKLEEEHSLVTALGNRLSDINNVNLDEMHPVDEWGDEMPSREADRHNTEIYTKGKDIDLDSLKEAIGQIYSSTALFSLFNRAKIRKTYCEFTDTYSYDILLYKEIVTYDTDEEIILKLKKKVFSEIEKYRRAKENAKRRRTYNKLRVF